MGDGPRCAPRAAPRHARTPHLRPRSVHAPCHAAPPRLAAVPPPRRIYRRFLQFDPSRADELVELLVSAGRWLEAADHIVSVLNGGSEMGDKDRALLLKLCDLLAKHADEMGGLKVEAVLHGAMRKFPDEAGRLWALLAECYARIGLYDKARDVLEEGLEQSLVAAKMEKTADEESDKLVIGCWFAADDDSDMCLARLERLLDHRQELLNSVLLRQNPHDVAHGTSGRHGLCQRATGRASYAARAAELYDVPKVRQAYEQAIESGGLPRHDALVMSLRLAALEEALEEAARTRPVFVYASGYADPDGDDDEEFWNKWSGFEVRHGDGDTFTDMLRIKHTQKHAKLPGVQAHGELKDEKKRCADQLGAPQGKRQRV
uniref:Uncharacterized protein n=1 Tax=Oryza punctata TaxID=4537 RepID=A0A0E0JKI7_ORYPU